ncbi:aminoglycoside 6-adenylyltransferase [Paenibacillus tarimensis]
MKVFGDLLIIQEPDKNNQACGMRTNFDRSYGYLMLFTDGKRIDLHIETKESMSEGYVSDKLTVPLLDKDNCLPRIPAPTDTDYYVTRPTEAQYLSCCNEFWWCLQNVAKGIWRDELPYARRMFEATTRASLDEMISWWIGTKHDFQVSTGKMGKYFKTFLPVSLKELYKETYSDSDYISFWNSIFVSCELCRTLAQDIAEHFSFTYETEDDRNMSKYLYHVRNLPADATEIF